LKAQIEGRVSCERHSRKLSKLEKGSTISTLAVEASGDLGSFGNRK